ncbi:MAG: hypothetical protein KKA73_03705 [Chloroflexi bacterium]|nr:hypothetical protein [Chloroflexota bacterium]MBU1746770.1 hypothetical protein [Chloroflexota bacterium]MBU1878620.1 hypothetical protein [Chloroflexota bacterium]
MLITDRVVTILAHHPDIIVPVKQVWRDLQVAGIATALPLEDFVGLLEDDPRIEFMDDLDFSDGDPEAAMAMEALGFVSGPRAKLVSRELTAAHIARMLETSTQNLVDALKEAWNLRPDDDPETDLELLLAIDAAEELRRSVHEALTDEPETEQPGSSGAES